MDGSRPGEGWRHELQMAITDPLEALAELGWETPHPERLREVHRQFTVRIPRYYFDLIDRNDPTDPIALQCLPQLQEIIEDQGDIEDAVGDRARSPVPGIIHKYPNRVIFLVANSCTMYCRYCFRKPVPRGVSLDGLRDGLQQAFHYVDNHPEIEEVILSGGDPLVLETPHLEKTLRRLRHIPHVQVIRIHSRVPVTLPSRMDDTLVELLGELRPLRLVTHFNHPRELTPLARAGIERLIRRGISVHNQTVLLKGINDNTPTLTHLFRELYWWGVTPYYLHHCDRTPGTAPFRLSIQRGRALMAELRTTLSGPAIPQYVIDIPGGYGKVPINADHFTELGPGLWQIRTPTGLFVQYRDIESSA